MGRGTEQSIPSLKVIILGLSWRLQLVGTSPNLFAETSPNLFAETSPNLFAETNPNLFDLRCKLTLKVGFVISVFKRWPRLIHKPKSSKEKEA